MRQCETPWVELGMWSAILSWLGLGLGFLFPVNVCLDLLVLGKWLLKPSNLVKHWGQK